MRQSIPVILPKYLTQEDVARILNNSGWGVYYKRPSLSKMMGRDRNVGGVK